MKLENKANNVYLPILQNLNCLFEPDVKAIRQFGQTN